MQFKREVPLNKIVYHRVPKYFYSFKLKKWIKITKPYKEHDGYFVYRDFIDAISFEKIDTCGDVYSQISERTLSYINNPKLF